MAEVISVDIFWSIVHIIQICCGQIPTLCDHKDCPLTEGGIPYAQEEFGERLDFTRILSALPCLSPIRMQKCVPRTTQSPKAENVRFTQALRSCRCFKSKCYLNRSNEVFERIFWSVPFEREKLSFLYFGHSVRLSTFNSNPFP